MCLSVCIFFVVKQKTAYEMRISDWSSDVCSSDLARRQRPVTDQILLAIRGHVADAVEAPGLARALERIDGRGLRPRAQHQDPALEQPDVGDTDIDWPRAAQGKSGPVRVDLVGRRLLK